ncbi:MAG TPA: glycogen debranching protein GlgX [Candidatus Wallbacteria bacterium]|nr:glycogen debranching protein GlgX [Candidatus Wallbacteria bacterium]
MSYKTSKGNPYPLGAAFDKKGGINFAIFSKNATGVTLELFNAENADKSFCSIKLDPKKNKTGDIWHIHVSPLENNIYYAYRMDGKYTPVENGHRFNKNKLLIDPYAKALVEKFLWKDNETYSYDRTAGKDMDLTPSKINNMSSAMKCVVIDDSSFDWEDDQPPRTPLNKTIIYETSVRGLTIHPSSKTAAPGTFSGLIEKIPYFRELGITAIELLPVHEFNENEIIRVNPKTGERLRNYWGYNSLSFFSLNNVFASSKDPRNSVNEFKKMVRELHKASIEVILDVVYNHTGEGNEVGPTISFKGIDNSVYYHLENNHRFYKNYSGCGNTLNCNHPAVKNMIIDSLRYFVTEMHVDGFRFDLASILGRSSSGEWLGENSLLKDIQGDPILSGTKLIAEGWDAGGCYKVGEFPEGWAEWNGKFRDDIRSFIKGDSDCISRLATRLCGSPDLYNNGRAPYHSINFVTCHDGFTLRDLVSYNKKNNFENGENNSDGTNDNRSYNYGAEGETGDPDINRVRIRQVKNFAALLMLAQGTPMILGGDEFFRTQRGNNNGYCQDNEISWHDWDYVAKNVEIFDFFKKIIAFRKDNTIFCLETFLKKKEETRSKNSEISEFITWHGVKLNQPDWTPSSHSIAFTLNGAPAITGIKEYNRRFYIVINAYTEKLEFEIPKNLPGKK